MAEPPPWADGLPDDALREIVRRVPCAIDRGSMAGVCREWRTRLARLPRPPPQFPWLIVSSDDSTRAYCVLSGGCVHHYRTNAPPHGARFFGSCEGAWLFLAFDQTSDNELVNLRHDRTLLAPDTFRLGEDDPFADGHDMAILAAALSSPPDKKNCVGACIISRWPAAPAPRRFHRSAKESAAWMVEARVLTRSVGRRCSPTIATGSISMLKSVMLGASTLALVASPIAERFEPKVETE